MKSTTDWHSTIVPGLDALIGDPDLLEPRKDTKQKARNFIIPSQYIQRISAFRDELSNRGEAAQKLLASCSTILEDIHKQNVAHGRSDAVYVCPNGMRISFAHENASFKETGDRESSIANAIATARSLKNQGHDVAILTGDDSTSALASAANIDVAHINPDVYTGRRLLELPIDAYSAWFNKLSLTETEFTHFFPSEAPLRFNEFVEFKVDRTIAPCQQFTQYIGRFEPIMDENSEYRLRMLHYCTDEHLPKALYPRNPGQAMFAEALLAPYDEVPIVVCPSTFGTGKTYLATGIGIYLTAEHPARYERIFVVPRDTKLGAEIGFLPGNDTEKSMPKAMPIIDNVREFLRNKRDKNKGGALRSPQEINHRVDKLLEDYFVFTSVILMGGRSIADSWIIYDEAQDLERFQINQLMKRIGDRSKMIITGDPHQVYNRHMNERSNGLSYAATKLAGSRHAVVVSLTENEIVRSAAAREIARLLDH